MNRKQKYQSIRGFTTKEAFQKVIEASKSEMLRIGEKANSCNCDRDEWDFLCQAQSDLNQAIWQIQNLSASLFGWDGEE